MLYDLYLNALALETKLHVVKWRVHLADLDIQRLALIVKQLIACLLSEKQETSDEALVQYVEGAQLRRRTVKPSGW